MSSRNTREREIFKIERREIEEKIVQIWSQKGKSQFYLKSTLSPYNPMFPKVIFLKINKINKDHLILTYCM